MGCCQTGILAGCLLSQYTCSKNDDLVGMQRVLHMLYRLPGIVALLKHICAPLQVPGLYTSQYSDAALSYPSTSYLDDMAYAASWMYYATKVILLWPVHAR
jgi:hypothetical protein